jgi:hypothetical protein
MLAVHLYLFPFQTEHLYSAGTMQVHIHQTYRVTPVSQGNSQVDGDGALANPALPAHDQKSLLDLRQLLGDSFILLLPFLFSISCLCI